MRGDIHAGLENSAASLLADDKKMADFARLRLKLFMSNLDRARRRVQSITGFYILVYII